MVKYEIAAVVAEFNYDITQMMLELAKAEAKNRDCEITKVVAKIITKRRIRCNNYLRCCY